MGWDESDADLKIEWDKSIARQIILDRQSQKERIFQKAINCLKMIEKRENKVVTVNDTEQTIPIIKYYKPINFAGDEMDADYRDSQKIDLIQNNKDRLAE